MMLIPSVFNIWYLLQLSGVILEDHLEIIAFLIFGTIGGGKKFIGTFTDTNGNTYDVYK